MFVFDCSRSYLWGILSCEDGPSISAEPRCSDSRGGGDLDNGCSRLPTCPRTILVPVFFGGLIGSFAFKSSTPQGYGHQGWHMSGYAG